MKLTHSLLILVSLNYITVNHHHSTKVEVNDEIYLKRTQVFIIRYV